MDIYPSSRDRIGLLNRTSIKSSPDFSFQNTYRSYSYGPSTPRVPSTPKGSLIDDTIHYLSPASTVLSTRTECEGDLFYRRFFEYREGLLEPRIIDYKSSSSRSTSSISCVEYEPQRTLAIIKPDAIKYKDVVLRAINESGLKIINERYIHLSPEQVSEIYQKYYGTSAFPHMVVSVSFSPILVMTLAGKHAVDRWKTMVGPYGLVREEWFFPYSVRTRFGILPDFPDVLHASENTPEAKWENRYFFPRSILEPLLIDEDQVTDYLTLYIKPTLLEGLIHLVRRKPADPVLFLAEWLLLNNPYQPHFPDNIALSPL